MKEQKLFTTMAHSAWMQDSCRLQQVTNLAGLAEVYSLCFQPYVEADVILTLLYLICLDIPAQNLTVK